jgi:hypothetical protein
MQTYRTRIAILSILLMAFFFGCSDEKNPVETQQLGEISGTVTFVGTWPTAGPVQVSVWSSWPPAGPPAAASNPAFTSGIASQTYKIEGLNKGTYPVITVGWRDVANPANSKVLGIYWANSDSVGIADGSGRTLSGVQPIAIEISDAKLKWSNVNIKANLDFAK